MAGFYMWETADLAITLTGDGNPLEDYSKVVVSIYQPYGRVDLTDDSLGIDVDAQTLLRHRARHVRQGQARRVRQPVSAGDAVNEITLDIQGKQSIDLSVAGESAISLGIERSTGTSNYNALVNKPSIEDVTLVGNKTFKQLGLEAMTPQEIDQMIYG